MLFRSRLRHSWLVGYTAPLWASTRVPKALDRISIGLPLPFERSSVSASFIHLVDGAGQRSEIVSGSWSRGLPYDASVYATVFADLGDHKSTGFFAGVSMPLGGSIRASVENR